MFYELFLLPAFQILNWGIELPYDLNGGTFYVRLYHIFILIFICNLISYAWHAMMSNDVSNGGD